MSQQGPLIVIEDDPDDQEMIKRILSKMELTNEQKFFADGDQALKYLESASEQPFLIISDINMPLMNGLDLKKHIQANETLRKKCYPFVFLTTTASPMQIAQAYTLAIEGFFAKGQSYDELKEVLKTIITYWKQARHPL
ncbi:MAG TPA: response regulator [Chryseosolibacter sp.]